MTRKLIEDAEPEHAAGERVTIFWPGGFYDFVIEFASLRPDPHRPGWLLVTGLVVRPEGVEHRSTRTFSVERVVGGYALLPKIP